jgi:hypothetical protein
MKSNESYPKETFTRKDLLEQKIKNLSLAWMVHGHKVPTEELIHFKKDELETIYQADGRPKVQTHIRLLFNANYWNKEKLI